MAHRIPAAPDDTRTDGHHFSWRWEVVIKWDHGVDFGACSNMRGAADAGLSPSTETGLWEMAVGPADDEQVEATGLPVTVYTVQFPPAARSVINGRRMVFI